MFSKKYDRALLITNPSAPACLGALALIHDDQQRFSVLRENGKIHKIPNHLVTRALRGIPQSEVKARLHNNIHFRVQQGNDGEFSLQEGGGLKGGMFVRKTSGENAAKIVQKMVNEHMPDAVEAVAAATVAATGMGIGLEKLSAAVIFGVKATAVGVTVAGGGYVIYQGVKYYYPNDEEQGRRDFHKYRQEFRQCLLKNKSERNADGIPSACAEALSNFKMVADAAQVDETTKHLKEFTQKN